MASLKVYRTARLPQADTAVGLLNALATWHVVGQPRQTPFLQNLSAMRIFVMSNTKTHCATASVAPSAELYGALEVAFNHYNNELFDGKLPGAIITLSAKGKGTNGYLRLNRFEQRAGSQHADEIALNPAHLRDELPVVMAWLVHHMVHLWQTHFDKACRIGYHDKKWAKKMMSLGLRPLSGEADSGKHTGQRVSQTIVPNGPFDSATKALIAARYDLTWQLALEADEGDAKEAGKSLGRVPWECPQCMQRAWAKPSAMLACGRCMVALVQSAS